MFFVFKKIKKHRFALYLLCYSILRFGLDFGRGDDRGTLFVNFLSPSQVISVFIWISLTAWLVVRIVRKAEAAPTFAKREYSPVKHRVLKSFARVGCVLLLGLVWLNPFNMNGIHILKQNISDFALSFAGERSTVTVLAQNSSTRATRISSDEPLMCFEIGILDFQPILELLSRDDDLGGEFILYDAMPFTSSGNAILYFIQTHKDIPIYGSGKQIALDGDGNALYVLGITKIGLDGVFVPQNIITKEEARTTISNYIELGATLLSEELKWYRPPSPNKTTYKLTYSLSLDFGQTIPIRQLWHFSYLQIK
jgi:hypothetical protein